MAASALVGACADDLGKGFGSDGSCGSIALSAFIDSSLEKSASRAEYNTVTDDDLSIRLTAADGSFSKTWNINDFPSDSLIKVGNYTIEAFYGDEDSEGFECPFFFGSQDIKVTEQNTTDVALTAVLANALLDITYTDNFKNYMTAWKAEVHSAGGSYFDYSDAETRPIYTKAGQVEVSVDFTKPNGNGGKLSVASFTAQPRHFYHLTVDVTNEGSGAIEGFDITLDDGMEELTFLVDISDEVLNAPAPDVTLMGASDGEPVAYIEGTEYSGEDLGFNIIAYGELAKAVLTTQSPSLIQQGWPAEFDLVSDLAKGEAFGLVGLGFNNPEKMAVANLTKVISHLRYVDGTDNNNVFTLLVTDKMGKQSEAVSFTVNVEALQIELADGKYYYGDDTISFTLYYNGGTPDDDVVIEYKNDLGVWTRFSDVDFTAVEGHNFKCVASIPANIGDYYEVLNLRASVEGIDTSVLDVTVLPQAVFDSKRKVNAFANYAYIPVTIGQKDGNTELLDQTLKAASVILFADGAAVSGASITPDAANRVLKVEGLTAGKEYTFKIINTEKDADSQKDTSFITEENLQLENGSLDDDVTNIASGSYWENVKFNGWGTNNSMTTSETSGSFAYGYTTISGTIQTTDAKSGKAALIRTVGWGSGNTATGSNGTSGNCKYRDPGLLHLGDTRTARPSGFGQNDNNGCGPIETTDLNCGIEFSSRPSSVSFWYKYSPKNSADKGQALVEIYDSNNKVIDSKSISLDAASTYTQKTVSLSYDHNSPKAAKLYIRFLSTADSQFLQRTNNNFSGPGFANLGRGTFMGSQLYIDEVVLNY